MSDRLKNVINELQYRIDSDATNILLIYDNMFQAQNAIQLYKERISEGKLPMDYLDNKIFTSIHELIETNVLTGLRFYRYSFIVAEG